MVAQHIALLPHGSGRDPQLRLLSVKSFTYSPHICMGFLDVLSFPPTSQKHADRWISS